MARCDWEPSDGRPKSTLRGLARDRDSDSECMGTSMYVVIFSHHMSPVYSVLRTYLYSSTKLCRASKLWHALWSRLELLRTCQEARRRGLLLSNILYMGNPAQVENLPIPPFLLARRRLLCGQLSGMPSAPLTFSLTVAISYSTVRTYCTKTVLKDCSSTASD